MELVVQLVLAAVVFGVTLSGGSLFWPKITKAPRPEALQKIHDVVIKTPEGAKAAQVLGVSDDKTVQPINLGQMAGAAWNAVKHAAEKRAQTIIMSQITQQLNNQYEKLPKDQQKVLQQIICNTGTSSGLLK